MSEEKPPATFSAVIESVDDGRFAARYTFRASAGHGGSTTGREFFPDALAAFRWLEEMAQEREIEWEGGRPPASRTA